MENMNFNPRTFIGKCKSLLPNYFTSLNEKVETKKDVSVVKKVILTFLKEYIKHNINKFNRTQFNVNFFNKFLLKLLPLEYPELSKIPLFRIQSIITEFINYLSLHKILDRNIQKEITKLFSNLSEKQKDLNKILNERELIEISNKIFDYSSKLNEIYNDEEEYNHVFNYFEKKPNKYIIEAILGLFKTMEDSYFLKILFFIDEFLKIETLPSKIIEILRLSAMQDRYFFRLLMLYNTFFLAGYIIKKPFRQLIEDLKVDKDSFYRYVANVLSYSKEQELSDFINFYPSQTDMEDYLDVDKYINEIIPITEEDPFANLDNYKIFNLPRDINLELHKHINFLKSASSSFRGKIKFINSSWDDWRDCFSNIQEKNLFKEVKRLYYDGKFQKALGLINKLIKRNPESAAVLYLKGKILGEQKAYYNALKCHLKSLKLDPYRIETYMDISFILEIGGYFHSSIILTSLLMRFCPFDFNLHLQLAISSFQLSMPFKKYLRLAGLIDAGRLINFLIRYWVHERIKSRDSLKKVEIGHEQFNELLKSSQIIISNANKVMKLCGHRIKDESFLNHLNDLLRNNLHFFPNKEDHIMKNWFVYELTIHLVENFNVIFYEKYYNLPYLVASEEFINLLFEIAQFTLNQILLTQNERKKQTSFEIDTEIILENEELFKKPIYRLARFFISIEGISNILMKTVINLINECIHCPNHCLKKPFKWCESFYIFGEVNEELTNYSRLIHFMESLNTDFEFFLEDKGLQVNTINKKVEHIEIFLVFLIKKVKDKDYVFISEKFEKYVSIENIFNFLGNYTIKNKVILTQVAMKEMCRSIKSFITFLNKDYGFFIKDTLTDLKKVLNSVDFFNNCLEKFQKDMNLKDDATLIKEWSAQILK